MKYSKLLKKNEVLILLFHGVVKKKYSKILDPASKHVTVKRFESIIKDLNSKGEPISLKKFFRLKKLKKKSFIITFDDGFHNNLLALKILKKFKVPATFYITTNFVKNNLMSWVDMIDYAVNKTKRKKINIINNSFNLSGVKNKIEFQKKIRIIVKNNMKIDESILAKKIQKKLIGKIVNTSNLEIYKKLNWEDIVKINKNELFDIGLHSHNHEILTKLSDKKLKRTIELSKNLLKQFTNINTDLFAYPDGQSNHYSQKVIRVLKKCGFLSSPTAIEGHNKLSSNKFRLRRFFAT